MDDEMAHEAAAVVHGAPVEAHSREDLRQEGPIDHPGYRPDGAGAPPGFNEETVELRSALASSLRPSVFPGDRSSLLATARVENAPDAVIRLLERLPAGAAWADPEEVWEAAGGPGERRPGDRSGGG